MTKSVKIYKLGQRVALLEKQMGSIKDQADRLEKDVPILTKQLADEDAQLQADEADLATARGTIADLEAKRDAVAASDEAEAARLQGQIDALEKLLKIATPPASGDGSTPPGA